MRLSVFCSTLRTGKGGLYRGVCTGGACDAPGAWSWCKVLNQRNVTGVVASPESSKVFYATVSLVPGTSSTPGLQGLWASRDGGATWGHVAEVPLAGLPTLSRLKLFAWPSNPASGVTDEPRTLYAGTGAGLLQGTVTCAAPGSGNPDSDGDGVSDYCDNCPSTTNAAQHDDDQNGIGNMCQPIAALVMNSIASEDGRIAESGENTSVGGAFDATLTSKEAILIGDSSTDKQWRSVLSFDTSALPDNAIPVSATLRLRRAKRMGNPYATLGRAVVDVKAPIGAPALEASDFQQTNIVLDVATLSQALTDEAFSTATLSPAGLAAIRTTAAHTQFRIRFLVDDDNDNTADFIGYYSGQNSPPGVDQVPTLQIMYVTP